MNNYTITNCVYDGTSGDPNPICTISGTVNGNRVFAPNIFLRLSRSRECCGPDAAGLNSGVVQRVRGYLRFRIQAVLAASTDSNFSHYRARSRYVSKARTRSRVWRTLRTSLLRGQHKSLMPVTV